MTHLSAQSHSTNRATSLQPARILRNGFSHGKKKRQRGVALAVALILLLVVTLVGLVAIHGTILQQKLASNLYDRQLAFQATEAAMRVAAARIATNPSDIARNCSTGGVICQANPFTDPNLSASKIVTVPVGSGAGLFQTSSLLVGQPQYVIENLGNWYDPSSGTGFNQSANSHQYDAQGSSTTSVYYRITARSGDPTQAKDRAIVTLQAVIKS
jgi:type IV pilus assembly protein PilX